MPHGDTIQPEPTLSRDAAGTGLLRVSICRGGERWSFACGPEDRGALLMEMLRLAEDPSVAFGAFDAAVVAHHLAGDPTGPGERAVCEKRAA
jgi:hypothetical protein